jgi:hypothetical protein
MKTILAATLLALTTQAQGEALEANLDGNAGALLASELRPAAKLAGRPGTTVPGSRADRTRTRTAASGAVAQRRAN